MGLPSLQYWGLGRELGGGKGLLVKPGPRLLREYQPVISSKYSKGVVLQVPLPFILDLGDSLNLLVTHDL